MRTELLRFSGAVERDPAIDAWMKEPVGELGAIAHQWFEVMRKCGDEVRELLHDSCPLACLGDAPFGYVNVFTSHVNVGFQIMQSKNCFGLGAFWLCFSDVPYWRPPTPRSVWRFTQKLMAIAQNPLFIL